LRRSPTRVSTSISQEVYFANRCSSDARSDGKTMKNDLSKAGIAEVTYS